MIGNKGFNPFWVAYKNLEDEFISLSKSICINDTQLSVYSMRNADLLVICAAQIEAISKALYKKYGGPTKTNAKGNELNLLFDCDCIKFLDAKLKICSKIVTVSSAYFAFDMEENSILTPLLDCDTKGKGDWKVAYHDVKHDRMQNLAEGNLKSFIRALAALYILNLYYEPITVQLGGYISARI